MIELATRLIGLVLEENIIISGLSDYPDSYFIDD